MFTPSSFWQKDPSAIQSADMLGKTSRFPTFPCHQDGRVPESLMKCRVNLLGRAPVSLKKKEEKRKKQAFLPARNVEAMFGGTAAML